MAYPALRTTKEVDSVVFNFLRRQFFTPDQAEALERRFLRSAQNVFPRRKSLPWRKRKKETLGVLLLQKTRICNVRRTSKHFPTIKVDFLSLTNDIVLRTIRTMTVSRNATNVRTQSKPLAYGSRPYMQFPVFGGRVKREESETLNPYISETAKDSPMNIILK